MSDEPVNYDKAREALGLGPAEPNQYVRPRGLPQRYSGPLGEVALVELEARVNLNHQKRSTKGGGSRYNKQRTKNNPSASRAGMLPQGTPSSAPLPLSRQPVSPPGSKLPAWRKELTARMVAGHEYCRRCGHYRYHVSQEGHAWGLRFGHLKPDSKRGGAGRANLTIVCGPCDRIMGTDDWTGKLPSLLDESKSGRRRRNPGIAQPLYWWEHISIEVLIRAMDQHQNSVAEEERERAAKKADMGRPVSVGVLAHPEQPAELAAYWRRMNANNPGQRTPVEIMRGVVIPHMGRNLEQDGIKSIEYCASPPEAATWLRVNTTSGETVTLRLEIE